MYGEFTSQPTLMCERPRPFKATDIIGPASLCLFSLVTHKMNRRYKAYGSKSFLKRGDRMLSRKDVSGFLNSGGHFN